MTEGLTLVRGKVNRVNLLSFAVDRKVADDDLGYAMHLALRERFGEYAPQPFRSFEDPAGNDFFLGYVKDKSALEASEGLADPFSSWDESTATGVFDGGFQYRSMPASWRMGMRMRFEVLSRPVRRTGKGSRQGRVPGERDAFLSAVEHIDDRSQKVSREDVYLDWLKERLASGAILLSGEMRSFKRSKVARSSHGKRTGRKMVEGPEALLSGVLEISDPTKFGEILARGVGRHCAFGMGMLLLRPGGK